MSLSTAAIIGAVLSALFCIRSFFPTFLSKIIKIIDMFFDYKKHEEELKKEKEIEEAKDKLKDATENGDLSDLIDSAIDLGNKKSKKIKRI